MGHSNRNIKRSSSSISFTSIKSIIQFKGEKDFKKHNKYVNSHQKVREKNGDARHKPTKHKESSELPAALLGN